MASIVILAVLAAALGVVFIVVLWMLVLALNRADTPEARRPR